MPAYSDYCPIAVGVDVLGDRWTPLVIRELMIGSTGFNQIHRGVPKMSRTLLAQRLRMLQRRGVVERRGASPGHPVQYVLTPAGQQLTPIVWALGHWAAEWAFGDPTDDEVDGLGLLWRLHTHALADNLPTERTVVHVLLTGHGGAEGWLDMVGGEVTVCKDDPGLDVHLAVQADTRQMQRWLHGLVPFHELVKHGHARVIGPGGLTRAFPTWFNTTLFAEGLERARRRSAAQVEQAAS